MLIGVISAKKLLNNGKAYLKERGDTMKILQKLELNKEMIS